MLHILALRGGEMEFLDTYKRLDNLCKDLLGSSVGITSYIKEMEECRVYAYKIKNWETDYRKLKHYRYIRNQIVHENSASESSLCNINDCRWLAEFYQRILNQMDPLSQYQTLINKPVQQSKKRTTQNQNIYYIAKEKQVVSHTSKEKQKDYYIAIGIIIVVLAVVTIYL